MSLLVLGLSHHDAPLDLLERVSLDGAARRALVATLSRNEHIAEAVVVSTCNRTEVYVEAVTFHGAVAAVTEELEVAARVPRAELTDRLALHFEDRAIAHAFRVASGLESMALGESQIRAQMRAALHEAQEERAVGPALNALFQQALRVGKRVHTDTGIESVSGSLIQAGLAAAAPVVGDLASARVLVVGAGSMAALAAQTAHRAGAGELTIVNRTLSRAAALASRVGGHAERFGALADALATADVVISCIGAPGLVVSTRSARAAAHARTGRPQVYLDLALPHDVDHAVGALPGVTRLGLEHGGTILPTVGASPQVQQAADIVTAEVAAYLTDRAALEAAPTISAQRGRASEVLEAELARLTSRTPELTDEQRREVEIAMGRLVDKLLHGPTVRVKELAARGDLAEYAEALALLFALDPHTVAAVSSPPPFESPGFASEPEATR